MHLDEPQIILYFFLFFYIISDKLQKESKILYVKNISNKISHIYHIKTKRKFINTMFSRHQKRYNHMAFTVTQRVISSEDTIYSYCDNLCRKAKLLYNAAFFVSVMFLPDMRRSIGQKTRSESLKRSLCCRKLIQRSMSGK